MREDGDFRPSHEAKLDAVRALRRRRASTCASPSTTTPGTPPCSGPRASPASSSTPATTADRPLPNSSGSWQMEECGTCGVGTGRNAHGRGGEPRGGWEHGTADWPLSRRARRRADPGRRHLAPPSPSAPADARARTSRRSRRSAATAGHDADHAAPPTHHGAGRPTATPDTTAPRRRTHRPRPSPERAPATAPPDRRRPAAADEPPPADGDGEVAPGGRGHPARRPGGHQLDRPHRAERQRRARRRARPPSRPPACPTTRPCGRVFGRFPILGPARWSDDWYLPRWTGTMFRYHLGLDMFAAYGTPVAAPADGVARIATNALGGLTVQRRRARRHVLVPRPPVRHRRRARRRLAGHGRAGRRLTSATPATPAAARPTSTSPCTRSGGAAGPAEADRRPVGRRRRRPRRPSSSPGWSSHPVGGRTWPTGLTRGLAAGTTPADARRPSARPAASCCGPAPPTRPAAPSAWPTPPPRRSTRRVDWNQRAAEQRALDEAWSRSTATAARVLVPLTTLAAPAGPRCAPRRRSGGRVDARLTRSSSVAEVRELERDAEVALLQGLDHAPAGRRASCR